ncbi:hypothetical protein MN116_003689 [Schistosoma mekongi]|uniref:EGF-like domain-containing protein n=1 Tax=Schistosoma mekongi TaxID=38744 RepID=A0AAE2D711_SCHME|nr:hypothetical protein MN116_003689 [Schistosoma mekongi]
MHLVILLLSVMKNCGLLRFIHIFLFHVFIYRYSCEIFNACSNNPCHSNGYCISNQNGGFYCRCLHGWTGSDCSVDVDECHLSSTSPCEHNGVCINSPGSYQCLCPPGYYGSRCENEVLECALNPCKHDGTCIDLVNGFQCICPLGYEGSTCEDEINECSSSPCKNGAQCEDLINSYACHCLPGWTGTHCENRLRPCANSSLCLNNATCIDLVTTDEDVEMNESTDPFVCLCAEGFRGKLCETKIINYHCMDTIVCQNGGKCTVDNNGKEYCKCLKNYQGVYCEYEVKREDNTDLLHRIEEQKEMIFDCFEIPCLNNGTCHQLDIINSSTVPAISTTVTTANNSSSTYCRCKPGYSGLYCENIQDYCQQKRPCHNEGICILQDLTNGENQLNDFTELNYTCICRPGYSGKHCEINIFDCFNQPCGSYGICKDEINDYHCECLKGWEGSHCEKFSLAEPVAYQKITGQNSTVVMHSISQRLHINESRLCPENYCANSAICILISYDNTFSSMSNGINKLDSLDGENEFKCLCETAIGRFEGIFCDIDVNECNEQKQLPPLCQNGGQCINTYGSYVCQCTTEYYGDRCEYLLNPCNHDDASICFNGGVCLPTSNNGVAGTLCICPKGFAGPQCKEHVNECNNKHPCAMNDGICLDLIGTYHCLCPTDRYGTNCEYTSKQACINQLCSEHEQVNVKNCTTHTCFNGGICPSYHITNSNIEARNNNSFNLNVAEQNNLLDEQMSLYCSCPFGYIGEYCQIELDFCQLFHHIKHLLRFFNDLQEMEDYFVRNLTITSYLFSDWLISSTASSVTTYSWYEINALYSTFIINYINSLMALNNATTTSDINSNSNTKKILSVKNLFMNSSLLDRKSTQPSNSTLFMIISPMGLCDPIGSSLCVSSISSAGNASQQSGDRFTCICHMDYEGRYCEKYVDFCDKANRHYNGNYCLNGGWCENQIKRIPSNGINNKTAVHQTPYCHCPPGFGGDRCEFYHELCVQSPCLHGGICHPTKQHLSQLQMGQIESNYKLTLIPPYICKCPFGWSGVHCEVSTGLKHCDSLKICIPHTRNCDNSLSFNCPCIKTGHCGLNCEKFGTECFLLANQSSSTVNEQLMTFAPATVSTTFTTTTTSSLSVNNTFISNVKKHQKEMNNKTLWLAEEIGPSYCLHENCYLKKHNGRCDHECNMIACDFDHGDCLYALSVPLNSLAYITEHIENNHNTSHYVSFSQDSQIKQHPEPAIPWRSCSSLTEHTEHTLCHLLFADGNCDKQCSEEECLFDGWDCMQVKVDISNTTKEICSGQCYYSNSTTIECNHRDYMDTNCTMSSNLKNDITLSADSSIVNNNNHNALNVSACTKHFTNHIVPGSLVLLINSTPEEVLTMYSEKLPESILSTLNEILHLEVEIEHHPYTGNLMVYPVMYITNYTNDDAIKDDKKLFFKTIQLKNNNLLPPKQTDEKSSGIRSRYSRHVNKRSSASSSFPGNELSMYQRESIGSQVYLRLNSKKCDETGGPCFHNVDYAAQFLTAYMHNRNHDLLQTILTVQSVQHDASSSSTSSSLPSSTFDEKKRNRYKMLDISIYITSLLICILFLIFVFGVLFTVNHFQRQRANYHLRSTGSFNHGRLGQKMIKKVLKAKIWYPSPDLIRNSRIMYNSPNNYKNSKFTSDNKKYMSSKLPMMEPQSTTTTTAYEEKINYANIKNKTVSELEKCLDMLQGRACDNNTIPYYNTMTFDNKKFTSLSSSPPPQSLRNHCNINSTFSDYGDINEIPPTLIKYSAHTSTIPTSCTSHNYFCHLSSPSKTQQEHNSYTPALTLTENDHNGSTSSTVTTTITVNGTNSFDDFDCQRNENFVHNYQTMQELYTFLNSICQSELNSFQKILQKVILDYYGSGESVEVINNRERQQRLYTASGRFQNTTENNNSDFNTVCYLLTQNDESNSAHTVLHNSMNSIISWQMIYNSTHLHRLLNLRIPDTGETLLHISARFNQSKAINNLLNAGADFSTVDNQGRTTLFTAVSAGAIESVQAILNHPTSGLSPFCYLPNLLQDSTTPLIQAIKLGDTDIFNMLLHAMNVLVCALTKTTFSRSQEYSSYDMMIGTSNDLLHIHSTSSSAAASSSSPPTAVTTPTPASTELNFEENTLNFLDINTSDSSGRTALHWAAVTDQSDIIHSLCNSGATLDAQTLHEETPLALACREGALTSCRILLLTGANSNLADYLDRTPRDLAYLGGHYDIVNLLDEYVAANSNTEYCGNLTKFDRKHDSFASETLTTPMASNTIFSSLRLSPTIAASVGQSVNERKGAKNRNARSTFITTNNASSTTIVDGTVSTALTTSSSQFSLANELTTNTDTTSTTINCNHTPSLNLLHTTDDSNSIPSLNSDEYIQNITNNDKRTLNSIQPKAFDNRQDHLKLFTNCKMVNSNNRNCSSGDIKAEVSNDHSLLKADYHFRDNINNSSNNTSTKIHTINPPNMGSDESESPNHWSSSSSDLSPNRLNNILQKLDEQQPPSSTIRGIHHSIDDTSNHYLMSKWKSCINVNNSNNRFIVNHTVTNPTAYHKQSFFTNCDQQCHFDGYSQYNHHHHQQQQKR